jgi:hypothetical protein
MARRVEERSLVARALACALISSSACANESKSTLKDGGASMAGHGGAAANAGGGAGVSASAGRSGSNASGGSGSRASAGNGSNASGGSGGTASGGNAAGGRGGSASAGNGGSAGRAQTSADCDMPVATAPSTAWTNVTGMLAGLESECGNLTLVAADPCKNRVIAGVAKRGLYATSDRGATWNQLSSAAGSANIVHRPSSIVFDPEHHDVIYESGIYGALNDGVYKSEDGGDTFKPLGTIGHIDLISVDFTDPARKTLLAGAHETKQKLFLSTDGGASFTDIGPKLPAGSHFSSAPLVLDAQRFLLGACGWGDGTCGVFASADTGQTWKQTSTESPVGAPLVTHDMQLVWATIYGSGAILSTDQGQSWTKVSGPHAGSPVELPDGRLVAVGSDHVIASSDHGKTWTNVGEPLPYQPVGVTYSPSQRAFFIWHNDCNGVVLADAVMSAGL